MKCLLGPSFNIDEEKNKKIKIDLQNGMLEDYECYLYTETKSKLSSSTIKLKLKEIRNLVYEALKDEVFQFHDMDSFIKDEIETKGIVIIDEIDKLVSNQNSSNISEASVSAEGV